MKTMPDLSGVIPREISDLQRIIDTIENAQLGTKDLSELYHEVEARLKVALLKEHLGGWK